MQADSALSKLLAKPLQVHMTGRPSAQLQLASPGNGTLSFTDEATLESLYGAGTPVFLEIASQSVACPNPPSSNTQCLLYRERHYDDKGLLVGTPGEWNPLTVNIEGYTHREGERNVLRVKISSYAFSQMGLRKSGPFGAAKASSQAKKPECGCTGQGNAHSVPLWQMDSVTFTKIFSPAATIA
jgi:hypothetical protein